MKRILIAALALFTPFPALAAAPTFDAPSITAAENAGTAPFVINKSAKATSYSKIRVQTVDGSAKAGVDYTPVDTTLTIANNTLHVTVPIPVINNSIYQGNRTFGVRLTITRNGVLKGAYEPVTVTIADDEVAPPPPTPCPDGSIVAAGATCPTGGLAGEKDIPDNFDGTNMLEATWNGPPVPGTDPALGPNRGGLAPINNDPVGAFRFFCGPGQLLRDDPIQYPGQPGKSHLHQFIGNTTANANSTYQSLRTIGGSTCDNRSTPDKAFNRSAYWMPAMLDGLGNVVPPDYALVYYKRIPKGHPSCGLPDATHIGICTDMPNGIKFIFGYDMKTMTGGPMANPSWDRDGETFDCQVRNGGGALAVPGIFHNIADVVAAQCPAGSHLHISLSPPTCWDGHNLDVADHRSHVVYATGELVVSAGERSCPIDHPYYLPNLAYQWYFTTNASFTSGLWRLSSDDAMSAMMGKAVIPGSTLHMDYDEGWSPAIKARFHASCINKHENCNNGDLGDGVQMKEASVPPNWFPVPPLVPLSSIP